MWNRFVRFCEGMLGRSLSLADVTEPTKVSIVGEVISANVVESPLSPVKTALLDWCVFARRVVYQSTGQGSRREVEQLSKLVTGRLGEVLIIEAESGTVSVPLAKVRFTPHAPIDRNAQPLMQRPPPLIAEPLARVPQRQHDGAEFYYGERYLSKGDRVSLRAVVEPTVGPAGGPYRGAGSSADAPPLADFRVVDDDEAPRLREIL